MRSTTSLFERIHHALHGHIILCLLITNGAGALWPNWGQSLRHLSLGAVRLGDATMALSVPVLLLAVLLGVAGLGVAWEHLRCLQERPQLVLWGLVLRSLFPMGLAIALAICRRSGLVPPGVNGLVVALALVAALPIAGAAPAWAQNANGNVALALGITVVSTLLSPFTIPLGIDLASHLTTGAYATDLQHLISRGTELFLVLAVALPCACTMTVRRVVGERAVKRVMPALKLTSLSALLLLNYINAAAALPQVLAHPHWQFLCVTAVLIVLICGVSFTAGPRLARAFSRQREDGFALLFCLGMCNNGAGLVLVAGAFQAHPHALQTLVLYGVIQQLVAGLATRWCQSKEAQCAEAVPQVPLERNRSAA